HRNVQVGDRPRASPAAAQGVAHGAADEHRPLVVVCRFQDGTQYGEGRLRQVLEMKGGNAAHRAARRHFIEPRGRGPRRAARCHYTNSRPPAPMRYSTISSLIALLRCLTTQSMRARRLPTRSLPSTRMVLAVAPMSPVATLRASRSSSRVSSVVTSNSVVSAAWS